MAKKMSQVMQDQKKLRNFLTNPRIKQRLKRDGPKSVLQFMSVEVKAAMNRLTQTQVAETFKGLEVKKQPTKATEAKKPQAKKVAKKPTAAKKTSTKKPVAAKKPVATKRTTKKTTKKTIVSKKVANKKKLSKKNPLKVTATAIKPGLTKEQANKALRNWANGGSDPKNLAQLKASVGKDKFAEYTSRRLKNKKSDSRDRSESKKITQENAKANAAKKAKLGNPRSTKKVPRVITIRVKGKIVRQSVENVSNADLPRLKKMNVDRFVKSTNGKIKANEITFSRSANPATAEDRARVKRDAPKTRANGDALRKQLGLPARAGKPSETKKPSGRPVRTKKVEAKTDKPDTQKPKSEKPKPKNPNRPRNMRLGKGPGKRGTSERKLLKKAADALRLSRTAAAGGAAGASAIKGLTAGRALLGLSGGPLGLALLGLTAGPALYGMATGQEEKERRARKRELDMASRMGGSPQLAALLAGKQNRQMAALADLASNAARRNQTPIMSADLQALIGGEEARLASMAQETPLSFNQAQAYAMGNAQQVADRTAPRMSL